MIWLYRAYPKRGTGHILKRRWNGFKVDTCRPGRVKTSWQIVDVIGFASLM